jgi:hypothetical protein
MQSPFGARHEHIDAPRHLDNEALRQWALRLWVLSTHRGGDHLSMPLRMWSLLASSSPASVNVSTTVKHIGAHLSREQAKLETDWAYRHGPPEEFERRRPAGFRNVIIKDRMSCIRVTHLRQIGNYDASRCERSLPGFDKLLWYGPAEIFCASRSTSGARKGS